MPKRNREGKPRLVRVLFFQRSEKPPLSLSRFSFLPLSLLLALTTTELSAKEASSALAGTSVSTFAQSIDFLSLFSFFIGGLLLLIAAYLARKQFSYRKMNRKLLAEIAQRRKTEEAFHKQENLLKLSLKAAKIGTWTLDLGDNRFSIQTYASDKLGYDEPTLTMLLKDWFSLVHPDDVSLVVRNIEACKSGESEEFIVEERLKTKEGGYRWFLVHGLVSEWDEAGNALKLAGVHRDITERVLTTQNLLRYASIVESSHDAIIGLLPDGTITSWNKGAQALYGYTSGQALGEHISMLFPKGAKETLATLFQKLQRGEKIENYRTKRLTATGETLHVALNISPIFDEMGTISGASTIARDVTEEYQQQHELRLQKKRAQHLLDIAGVMFIAIDKNGLVTLLNRKAEQVLGYREEELLGKSWLAHCIPKEMHQEIETITERLRRGDIELAAYYENPVLTKSGVRRYIAWYNSILRDINGDYEGLLSSGEDITEKKNAEAELRRYQQRLRSLASELILAEEKQRKEIATMLHDDTCQSLAMVIVQMKRFRDSLDEDKQRTTIDGIIEMVDKTMQSARSLTFDISPPVLYEFGLEEAVKWLFRKFEKEAGFSATFYERAETIPIDEDIKLLLYGCLRELLMNVVKHAQASEVQASIDRDGRYIVLWIVDDGKGFELDKLRDKRVERGGFGLFSIQERIRYFGGEVDIDATPSIGTRISLRVPMRREAIWERKK